MNLSLDSDGSKRLPADAGVSITKARKAALQIIRGATKHHHGLTFNQKKYAIAALTVFNLSLIGATASQDNQTRVQEMRTIESMLVAQPEPKQTVIQPVAEPEAVELKIEAVKTTPTPSPTPTPTPTTQPQTAVAGVSISRTANYSTGAVGIDDPIWDQLASCESGQRWDYNGPSGYDGGLQFSPSTWNAMNTGYDFAWQAPREVQIAAASRLQARSGWGQWPACARKLGLL